MDVLVEVNGRIGDPGAAQKAHAALEGHIRQGLLQRHRRARNLDDGLRPPSVGEFLDCVGQVLLVRREGVVGSEGQGEIPAALVEVRDDHRDGAVDPRRLSGEHAQKPQADDHRGLSQLELDLAHPLQAHGGDGDEGGVQ